MSKLTFNYWGKYYPSVNSFEEAEKLYKDTKPIRGPRKALDIRPIGNDRRYHYGAYRAVKVTGRQYTLTAWYEYTWSSRNRDTPEEHLGVTWTKGKDGFTIHGCWWNNAQINFVSQVLPDGMWLTRYDTKIYLSIKRPDTVDHFLLPTDAKEYLNIQKVDGQWVVMNPKQEYRRRVTAKLQQQVLKDQKLQEFENYANTMWDMFTKEVAEANGAGWQAYWTNNVQQVKQVLSDKSQWVKACCELKRVRYTEYMGHHDLVVKSYNPEKIRRTLYKIHKDKFNTTEVPIGTTCCRHWLDK